MNFNGRNVRSAFRYRPFYYLEVFEKRVQSGDTLYSAKNLNFDDMEGFVCVGINVRMEMRNAGCRRSFIFNKCTRVHGLRERISPCCLTQSRTKFLHCFPSNAGTSPNHFEKYVEGKLAVKAPMGEPGAILFQINHAERAMQAAEQRNVNRLRKASSLQAPWGRNGRSSKHSIITSSQEVNSK